MSEARFKQLADEVIRKAEDVPGSIADFVVGLELLCEELEERLSLARQELRENEDRELPDPPSWMV